MLIVRVLLFTKLTCPTLNSGENEMKALIIAAGMGRRIKNLGDSKPLINLLGLPLIERVIVNAIRAGIRDFVVVVGYNREKLEKELKTIAKRRKINIKIVFNPEWEKDNGLSVLAAKEYLQDGKFLLLMSDHIHDDKIIENLKNAEIANDEVILAVDYKIENNHYVDHKDATKVLVEDGCIVDIGKNIENFNAYDTGAFLCTPVIFSAIEKSLKESGDGSLSGGIRVLSKRKKARVLDIGELFWVDVDDKKAYKKAEEFLLKKLVKPSDGPVSRYINRPLSRKITKFFIKLPFTPNQITVFNFLLSVISGFLFTLNGYIGLLFGGLLTQFSSIFDGVDGEIARLKYLESKFGKWLDSVLDRYADAFILGGLTWHTFFYSNRSRWSYLIGLFAIVGSLINSYIAMEYDRLMIKKGKEKYFRIGRDVRLFVIFLGSIADRPVETLLLIASIMNFENIRRIVILRLNESFL